MRHAHKEVKASAEYLLFPRHECHPHTAETGCITFCHLNNRILETVNYLLRLTLMTLDVTRANQDNYMEE